MKFGQLIIGLLLGGIIGFSLTKYFAKPELHTRITTTKSDTSTSTKWPWPDSLDAVKAAPKNHNVIYDDSNVRVLQVLLNAKNEEPIHTHKCKSIMWISKPALPCIIYKYDLNVNRQFIAKDSINIPHMDINIGYLIDAEGPTGIKNLGNNNGIAYRVELKKDFKQ